MSDGQILGGPQYMVPALATAHGPADATTYYFSHWGGAPSTSEGIVSFFPRDGQIRRVWLHVLVAGTLGTSELGTASLRINNLTDYLISSSVRWDSGLPPLLGVEFDPGAGPQVVTGDYWEIKLVTPTWVTNPTVVLYNGGVWVENQ